MNFFSNLNIIRFIFSFWKAIHWSFALLGVKYLFFVFKNKFILMCILFDFRLILAEVLEFQGKKLIW